MNKDTWFARLSLACLLAVAIAGCGGDDDGSGTIAVDGSKAINELTQSEAQAVCEAALDLAKRAQEPTCTFAGIMARVGGGDCEETRQACLGDLDAELSCADVQAPEASVACDVTVDEVEKCLDDSLALLSDFLPDLSCSTSLEDLQNMDPQGDTPQLPASCQALSGRCSALTDLGLNLGSDSETSDQT